ncbi:MAG TPA: diguanylate cyclase [Solirubrobacteraceae bacterium]|nr:diguanylate cyclase [Solirubrobacteraceae bacterium]
MTAFSAHMRRLRSRAVTLPEERVLAGRITGWLYLVGALTLAVVPFVPGAPHKHRAVLLVVAAVTAPVGLATAKLLPWRRAPSWLIHVFELSTLCLIAVVTALSGGARSPLWAYFVFPGFFAAYFFRRPEALGYLILSAAVAALPLLYDGRAVHEGFLAPLVVIAPALLGIGIAISYGKRYVWTLRSRAQTLAAEQSALRRVATAVVGGADADEIFNMVASEMGALLDAGGAGIMRRRDAETLVVVGSWAQAEEGRYPPGAEVPIRPGSDVAQALATGGPVSVGAHEPGSPVDRLGYASSLVAPVQVGGQPWGLLAVASSRRGAYGGEREEILLEFRDLLATAIASAEERARLSAQALTDSLTGLANQRALYSRLEAELARAARRGTTLSVAMIDIDHFKEINDNAGHDIGDEMLARVAAALSSFARAEDILGRVGGDEFAWVLPDTSREQALVAVERARRLIAAAPPDPYTLTISAGVCDTGEATEAAELIRLADSALYWSKAHGRNQTWLYDPAVVSELSEHERARRLERAQALDGLKALIRAGEGRDPAIREHSERVAALAGRLAAQAGWPRERALLLGQAAVLHDIGRITAGGPARPMPGPGGLEPDAVADLRERARLSARIVRDVLEPEQVAWIAGQYGEPAAGGGGAGLIALADAWDTMTAVSPGLPEEAFAECQRLGEECFGAEALRALSALLDAGELGPWPLRAE